MDATYANQYNNPNDLYRQGWNESQVSQQHYLSKLSGGSWSQPPWSGWHPIIGAGTVHSGGNTFLKRYAQDGDSGFFHRGMSGRGEPLGMSPFPPNHFPEDETAAEETYVAPQHSTAEVITVAPHVITEPAPMPVDSQLEVTANYHAEPEQHATHVPPYSHLLQQGMGKNSALFEEPFEIPEYKGTLHKKKGLRK